MGSIQDIHAVNNDAVSYNSKNLEKFLETSKRKKKRIYLTTCLN